MHLWFITFILQVSYKVRNYAIIKTLTYIETLQQCISILRGWKLAFILFCLACLYLSSSDHFDSDTGQYRSADEPDVSTRPHGIPENTKHLYNVCTTSAQRLRRWSTIVQMLYKCFAFTGIILLCLDGLCNGVLGAVYITVNHIDRQAFAIHWVISFTWFLFSLEVHSGQIEFPPTPRPRSNIIKFDLIKWKGMIVSHKLYCRNPVSTKNLHNICTMLDQRRRRWADVV